MCVITHEMGLCRIHALTKTKDYCTNSYVNPKTNRRITCANRGVNSRRTVWSDQQCHHAQCAGVNAAAASALAAGGRDAAAAAAIAYNHSKSINAHNPTPPDPAAAASAAAAPFIQAYQAGTPLPAPSHANSLQNPAAPAYTPAPGQFFGAAAPAAAAAPAPAPPRDRTLEEIEAELLATLPALLEELAPPQETQPATPAPRVEPMDPDEERHRASINRIGMLWRMEEAERMERERMERESKEREE